MKTNYFQLWFLCSYLRISTAGKPMENDLDEKPENDNTEQINHKGIVVIRPLPPLH